MGTSANPTKAWTRLLGTSSDDRAHALTTGTDGTIYMAGTVTGNIDGQPNTSSSNAFLTKFNPDGTKAWTTLHESSESATASALTTGTDGAIYMAGNTNGKVVNGLDGQFYGGDVKDAFLTKWSVSASPTLQFATSSGVDAERKLTSF